jgi:hypothetical protein
VDLNIRGEMEAVAAALEADGQEFGDGESAPPADVETTKQDESTETASESTEDSAQPATEAPAEKAEETASPEEDGLPTVGAIPVARVKKILANAREKAKAEAEAAWTEKYKAVAWAEGLDPDHVSQALGVWQFADAEPIEFYRRITQKLLSDPNTRDGVHSVIGVQVVPPKGKEKDEDARPEPDVLLEDGRMVYSAERTAELDAWRERQFEKKIAERVKPIEEERKQVEFSTKVRELATAKMAEVMKWPGMDSEDNRKAVGAFMCEKQVDVDTAYKAVLLPKLTDTSATEKRIREKVLAELKTKGRAAGGDPAKTTADPNRFKGKSIREVLEMTAAELGGLDDE